MRRLIATVFNYSLDGLLADEGTEFWKFCFDLPENREPDDPAQLDFLQSAYAHIMGRTAYEGIAGAMTTSTDHPFADILNAGRKVVFSRTLKTADWVNTTIAAGDTAEEIDKLRQGGDGHIVVWGGVSFWRSLMRLDLIDEFQVSLFPYVAGEGTRLFDDVPRSYRLDLVSSTASSNGILELEYRAAPLTQRPSPRRRSCSSAEVGRQALIGRVELVPPRLGVVPALTPGEVVGEIFDMELHPGPVRGEQVQRHAPFLPDHDGLVAVGGQHGLDLLLVRLVRVLDAHQHPLRGLAHFYAPGAFPSACEKAYAVLTAGAQVALDLAVPAGQT
jgi:dihydrofolate reductase